MEETIEKIIKSLQHDAEYLRELSDESRLQGFLETSNYQKSKASGIEYAISQIKQKQFWGIL